MSLSEKTSKNYILVHGAWHGSWCWYKVAAQLQNLGHKVITPDLPGHYLNKRHFKEVTLKSYVEHIENLIRSDQQPVVLVGHSMAGVVITQVAENMPERIDRLIYISAFIPQNGNSLADEEKQATTPTIALEIMVDEASHTLSLSPKRIRELFYGNCREEDVEYALSRLQKQPFHPFRDPISISKERFASVPKLYIECTQDKAIMIQDQRRMHSKIKCQVEAIETDHSPFFSADRQLVTLICNSSGRK